MLVRSAAHYGYKLRVLVLNQSRDSFVYSRVEQQLAFLRAQCERSVVMMLDAYDLFMNLPAEAALQRFLATRSRVVWAVERAYTNQDEADKPFYDRQRDQHKAGDYAYVNSGSFIGFASALGDLVEEALTIRPGASGWRNKCVGVPLTGVPLTPLCRPAV